jgi:hypothetical protein
MKQGEQYVIQGTASTFTYVNLGNEVITVEGSNDNDIWDEIIQVAPKDSEVKVHSFKFLKCTGGVLAVSRGVVVVNLNLQRAVVKLKFKIWI